MNENHYTEKLLEKTYDIVKNNIDEGKVKTEVFSIDVSPSGSRNKDYLKVSINKKEYDRFLNRIMKYFIKNEWYEDCVFVKEYQTKLKKLQDNNEQVARVEPEPVEAEL